MYKLKIIPFIFSTNIQLPNDNFIIYIVRNYCFYVITKLVIQSIYKIYKTDIYVELYVVLYMLLHKYVHLINKLQIAYREKY
jgi:hypothetical protein